MADARFEDAGFSDAPLRLKIEDGEDLPVVSTLVQDAVGLAGEITWMPRRRRAVMLLNRFRWEDMADAEQMGRPFERVRAALVFDSVISLRANGLNPSEKDTIYAILSLAWAPGEDASGMLEIALAGDGALSLSMECLDGQLVDLTRPWEAKSNRVPDHKLDDE
ncbi:MAG: DUF2948 family protein [Pseudomonadota bacterium]